MGKKKIGQMSVIENNVSRNITYCKRKKGLVKKAMEISMLCAQQVYLVMYDKETKKLILYKSSGDVDSTIIKNLFSGQNLSGHNIEFYTDENYHEVANSRIKTKRHGGPNFGTRNYNKNQQESDDDEDEEDDQDQSSKRQKLDEDDQSADIPDITESYNFNPQTESIQQLSINGQKQAEDLLNTYSPQLFPKRRKTTPEYGLSKTHFENLFLMPNPPEKHLDHVDDVQLNRQVPDLDDDINNNRTEQQCFSSSQSQSHQLEASHDAGAGQFKIPERGLSKVIHQIQTDQVGIPPVNKEQPNGISFSYPLMLQMQRKSCPPPVHVQNTNLNVESSKDKSVSILDDEDESHDCRSIDSKFSEKNPEDPLQPLSTVMNEQIQKK